jgi:hypothetical protein
MPDHLFQHGSATNALCLQLPYSQVNRGGEFMFFINNPSTWHLNFARGNAICDRLQDFGEPKESGIFLTQGIHLRGGRGQSRLAPILIVNAKIVILKKNTITQ